MAHNQNSPIIIIGGGVAGLAAAYDLGRNGFPTILFEENNFLGGLASTISFSGQEVERYYHFICASDFDYFEMAEDLGISEELIWETGITKFFYEDKMYRFSTPFDLIRFNAVPFGGRIRFGVNIIRDRFHKNWEAFDGVTAREWLVSQIGEDAYKVIWDPLLRIKFGEYHDQISAAWVWHRIWRVAKSRKRLWEPECFGYLSGGTKTLIDAFQASLSQMTNVTIRTQAGVEKIELENGKVSSVQLRNGEKVLARNVISTISLDRLRNLIDDEDFSKRLDKFKYIGVVCGLVKLQQPLTDGFWVNINDHRIPFNGMIEYTNLNRRLREQSGSSFVYIPYYLPVSHPRFNYTDEELKKEFVQGMKIINPAFDEMWIQAIHISRSSNAQAICFAGFKEIKLSIQTQISGLFVTDSTIFYPEDRNIGASIRLGRKAARLIISRGN
jgi:protoporphyrinogen oxidase